MSTSMPLALYKKMIDEQCFGSTVNAKNYTVTRIINTL